jgi:hypothetical protein|tara:strand:+ start:7732 stop:8307 length:576 start_codon:yes stop_codon:yes gene_type:complete
MSDLLSQMMTDSGSSEDQLDKLDDSKLDAVSRLAAEASTMESSISDLENQLRQEKSLLRKITDELLPEALEAMNLQKFTLTDGSEIAVKPVYAASIPKDRKEEAYAWLREHDYGDLVKNNVTVTFGRGEDEKAVEFQGLAQENGFDPIQLEKVEAMTLKGWLRERVEAGDAIPLDLFGAYISNRATITRSK